MAGIHKHILDFEILELGNPKTIVFVDASQYMETPERPLLEIIPPGYNKYFLVNVQAGKVNTFNSSTIGFHTVLNQSELIDLPDGIWEYKYKICPYKYVYVTKRFLKSSLLNNRIEYLYERIDLQECHVKEDEALKKDLVEVHLLIEGAKSTANKNPEKASSYYKLADKLVGKLLDKFCKNCK